MVSERSDKKLYLEHIGVGLEFRSPEHRPDAEQTIAFASQLDPQPFHLDAEAAWDTFPEASPSAGGTPWRSP
jgi:acyl dehydratase